MSTQRAASSRASATPDPGAAPAHDKSTDGMACSALFSLTWYLRMPVAMSWRVRKSASSVCTDDEQPRQTSFLPP